MGVALEIDLRSPYTQTRMYIHAHACTHTYAYSFTHTDMLSHKQKLQQGLPLFPCVRGSN